MRKPIYLPPPPAEIKVDIHSIGAQSQLAALRHREAQIAATVGIVYGILISLTIYYTFLA